VRVVTFELGDPVRVEMRKWGNLPHWEFDARWLGSDEHGDWIGIPAGTGMDRPGAHVVSMSDQVGLAPRADLPEDERWWVGTFHAPGGQFSVSVYVDIATPPTWDGATLRTIDLDLDVVRGETGRVWIDDEDEFAQHRVQLGYPAEVTAGAMRSCDRVHAAIAAGLPPYDGSHRRWLSTLADLSARS
jgi:uncharacterized protein